MRILLIQDYLRVGGTEHQTLSLAEHWMRAGHEVLVITFRPGGTLQSRVRARRLSTRALQPLDTGLNFWAPGWKREIRGVNPDAVVLMGRCANELGWRIKRAFPNIRLVCTVRTGRPLTRAYRKSLAMADRVLVNSRWARERLKRECPECPDSEVIPNALIRRPRAHQPDEWRALKRAALGMAPETVVLVYTAAFIKGKNHAALLVAFSRLDPQRLPDSRLVFLGKGPLMKSMMKLANRLGVGSRVLFAGYQNPPGPWLAAGDIYVSPSLEESMPNAVMEAQAVGLPVVAFDVAGVGEALIAGETGYLVPKGDGEALQEQIEALAGNREWRKSMGKAARKFSELFFTPEEQAARFLEGMGA